MAVQYINTLFPGEIGVHPRLVRLACNDTYAAVTAVGYLGANILASYPIYPDDYIFTVYGTGQFAVFNATITNSVVTLVPYIPPGVPIVTGATVVNDIASFNNTTGGITDSGISKNSLSTFTGATVVGDFPKFNSTTGQLIDSGIAPSAPSKPIVASVNGASVGSNVPVFADVNGTISDSGIAISALQLKANIRSNTLSWGGGSTSNAFTITGITTSSIVWGWVINSSNPSFVESVKVLSANTATFTFNADPGAGTVVGYIAFIAPQ